MGAEDAEKQHNTTSPDERLRWETEEMLEDYSPLAPRRGKKRARSSSPVSSPAYDKARTTASNVKRLKQALTSQRVDPALELWDRFGVGVPDSDNSPGATNPVLAHLMVSSSPRPSKDSVPSHGESGLRRAISCGSHWPKRRRVEPTTAPDRSRQRESSKFSMVTALLETVNSEISKPDDMEEANLSSQSPSIRERRSSTKPIGSPTPALRQNSEPAVVAAPRTNPEVAQSVQQANSPSSDYGDDDFDDATILELDASMLSGQVGAGSFTATERALTTEAVQEKVQQQKPILEDEFEDEFDDLDDDLLLAAEDVIKLDPPTQPVRAAPIADSNAVLLDGAANDSEDTYDDDFGGDFDCDALELAATQSVSQKASSLMPVRTV